MPLAKDPRPCDSDGCGLPGYAVGVLLVDPTEPTCTYCAECVRVLGECFRITEMLWWGEMSVLPRGKYVVIEQPDGWHVYGHDDGSFS